MLPNNPDLERPHGGMPDRWRRHRPAREDLKGIVHPQDEAWGTSRGGLSTKLHLRTDGGGRPLVILATPGQRHEVTQLQALLDAGAVKGSQPDGQPRIWGLRLTTYARSLLIGRGSVVAVDLAGRVDPVVRTGS
jgi:hypothetical protein